MRSCSAASLEIPATGLQRRDQLLLGDLRGRRVGGRSVEPPQRMLAAAGWGAIITAGSTTAAGEQPLDGGADLRPWLPAAADGDLAGHVAELADVARPVVAGEPGDQARRQPEGSGASAGVQPVRLAERGELPPQEVDEQAADVVAPLAQRRQPDLVAGQAVEERGAELPRRPRASRSASVAASTRTSTRCGLWVPTGWTSPVSSVRSSITCTSGVRLADLVEEQGAAVRLAEIPFLLLHGAGVGPAGGAEELRGHQRRRMAPRLTAMNGPLAGGPASCSAGATSSLPVPVSPRSSTPTSTSATPKDLSADPGDRRALPNQTVGLADREPGRNEEVEQQDHEACHLQHGPLPDLGQGEHAAAVDRLPVQDDPRVAFVQPNLDAARDGKETDRPPAEIGVVERCPGARLLEVRLQPAEAGLLPANDLAQIRPRPNAQSLRMKQDGQRGDRLEGEVALAPCHVRTRAGQVQRRAIESRRAHEGAVERPQSTP